MANIDAKWLTADIDLCLDAPDKVFHEQVQEEMAAIHAKISEADAANTKHFVSLGAVRHSIDAKLSTHPETAYIRGAAITEVLAAFGILEDYYEERDIKAIDKGSKVKPDWELLIPRSDNGGVFRVTYSSWPSAGGAPIYKQETSYRPPSKKEAPVTAEPSGWLNKLGKALGYTANSVGL